MVPGNLQIQVKIGIIIYSYVNQCLHTDMDTRVIKKNEVVIACLRGQYWKYCTRCCFMGGAIACTHVEVRICNYAHFPVPANRTEF